MSTIEARALHLSIYREWAQFRLQYGGCDKLPTFNNLVRREFLTVDYPDPRPGSEHVRVYSESEDGWIKAAKSIRDDAAMPDWGP